MAKSGERKVQEGDKLFSEAEKSLKTNWLKWNPDYDNASNSFDKAASCYRSAKAYEKAIDAFERASDAYYKNHALFHSGKALEQAANIFRDKKEVEQAANYLERSSAMYHESGHGDTAGQVLMKAAKMMELVDPHKAAYYYLATADLHEIEEKYRDAANAVKGAVNMYARARHLDTMLDSLRRLKKMNDEMSQYRHQYEVVAIEVIIHLHNDDSVAASDVLSTAFGLSGFADSDYASVLQTLVEAYREKDEEVFNRCCDDSIFKTMDNEIAKLARDLKRKLDFDGFQSSFPPVTSQHSPSAGDEAGGGGDEPGGGDEAEQAMPDIN